jgi:hypothetical protein
MKVPIAIFVWERSRGKKPKRMDISYLDGDRNNHALDNLELVPTSDRQRIEAGWKRLNGEWIAKPCKACEKVLPVSNFYQSKNLIFASKCVTCTLSKDNTAINLERRRLRAGWVKTGDEWTAKPCKSCKQIVIIDYFYQTAEGTYGSNCVKCAKRINTKKSNKVELTPEKKAELAEARRLKTLSNMDKYLKNNS